MKSERLAWGASSGAIIGYALAVLTSLPIRILYYPHSNSWSAIDLPEGPPIRWYGYLINAALGASIGMAVTWRIRPRWTLVWVLALVVLAYLAFHERHWFHAGRLP
jgi:hypothetical protein